MPRHGIAGPYDISIFSFLRNPHANFHSDYTSSSFLGFKQLLHLVFRVDFYAEIQA